MPNELDRVGDAEILRQRMEVFALGPIADNARGVGPIQSRQRESIGADNRIDDLPPMEAGNANDAIGARRDQASR